MDASGAILHQTDMDNAVETASHGVGDTLKLARLRADLSLHDVASATKINSEYLEAIESMDRAALPPRAYALGFVRCYANHLGLQADEMVSDFKTQFYDGLSPLGDLSPRPAPAWVDFRLPRGTGIVLVVVCALSLATWYGLRAPSQSMAAVPAVPEALEGWAKSQDLNSVPNLPGSHISLDDS